MRVLMFLIGLIAVATVTAGAVKETIYPVPAATYEASDHTVWSDKEGKSKRGTTQVNFVNDGNDDAVSLIRLDLVGNAYERGFAYGKLLNKEIREFIGPKMDQYYIQMVMRLDFTGFPERIQKVLQILQLKGATHAPEVFKTAMAWVWNSEKDFVPTYVNDEINGMANGMCAASSAGCNVTEWIEAIQTVNMLPELVKMACTAYGAWGSATPDGGLVQLRALDFGGGPFVNYTIIAVYRDDKEFNSFATVTFPGMVGIITGVSQSGLGISQKVWTTYEDPDMKPGSYVGEADIFVLRDLLQNIHTKEEALAYVNSVTRTWGIWIGVGDYASQKLNLLAYQQSGVDVFDDVSIAGNNGASYIENIAFVDKHQQPSHFTDLSVALNDFHGNVTLETSKTIAKFHQTGDVHIASYDFLHKAMYVAIGKANEDGQYGPVGGDMESWKAYNRPYFKFNLEDLWAGK